MNDLICFSHLRWHFVYQRPQHLMARAAQRVRVWFVEAPLYGAGRPRMDRRPTAEGVVVCVPMLPSGMTPEAEIHALRGLVESLAMAEGVQAPVAWVTTPTMQPLLEVVRPRLVVYDCMDELPASPHAPAEIAFRERALLANADLVFTGGRNLYEARLGAHPRVYLFPPSSWDATWAEMARLVDDAARASRAAAVPVRSAE